MRLGVIYVATLAMATTADCQLGNWVIILFVLFFFTLLQVRPEVSSSCLGLFSESWGLGWMWQG
jgi:hypothetical protein